jgi:chromosome partitioning protein
MQAKTIVVTNRKGGVGKTTTAVHLASGLAQLGWRVALVDTDPQGHVASAFGMKKENGLYTIMVDEDATFSDVMRMVPAVNYTVPGWDLLQTLYLLPGDKATALIPGQQRSPLRFRRVLREMADLLELDYIVVDTGPSNSMFDGSVMLAADHMIYVTECAALSFDGLREAVSELKLLNRDNKEFRDDDVTVLGIVPNKARFSTNNHRDNIADLAKHFGREQVWYPITLRTVWESAMEYGQTVYSYSPYGQEFRDAWTMVEQAMTALGVMPADMKLVDEIMKGATAHATA